MPLALQGKKYYGAWNLSLATLLHSGTKLHDMSGPDWHKFKKILDQENQPCKNKTASEHNPQNLISLRCFPEAVNAQVHC